MVTMDKIKFNRTFLMDRFKTNMTYASKGGQGITSPQALLAAYNLLIEITRDSMAEASFEDRKRLAAVNVEANTLKRELYGWGYL
jgi:hypothetical protein